VKRTVIPVTNSNPSYDPEFSIPCTAGWEFITPDRAKQMLDAGNRRNRKLSHGHVQRLRHVVERGEWMFDSTDAIGIATDGSIVNGQHRAQTIAEGDVGLWCLVVRGVRPKIINVIDQGSARNLTQTLQIDGSYVDPGAVSQAVDWAHRMVTRHEKTLPQEAKPSVPQLLEWLTAHPRIVDSLEPAKQCHSKRLGLRVGMMAAYHYAFSCVDAQLADDFFEQLATGLDVGPNDPAYTLRERLIKDQSLAREKQLKPWQSATLLVKAWEAAREGREIPAKAFAKPPTTATQVPTVNGVDWLGTGPEVNGSDDE
jgi:hypothetical protein